VLFEELGVEVDDVPGLGVKSNDVDTARQGLQVCICSGYFAELVHHFEGVFIGVEVR